MPDDKRQRGLGLSDADAVQAFKELLSFKTVSGTGHLDGSNLACVEYLTSLCRKVGLETTQLKGPRDDGTQPVLVAKWAGARTEKPAVLLNSHYDVVPVIEECWTRPAFEAYTDTVDGEERIYGRGAQDMKVVPIGYIAAVSRLIADDFEPDCDVYLSFVPDEEVGGAGMAWFLECEWYKATLAGKIGCAFDEGIANVADAYTVFYGERTPWWVVVEATGPTGHGSRFIEGTATHTLHAFIARALAFRKEQEKKLFEPHQHGGRCSHAKHQKLGDVTTVNLTMLRAGVSMDGGQTFAINVIPTEAQAGFDVRIPVNLPHAELEAIFTKWCREAEKEWGAAEGTLKWKFAEYGGVPLKAHHTTSVDPAENLYFKELKAALQDDIGVKVETEIFPAATDSRFLRELKIPCFGFSPMRKCPVLLHEHDEYLPTSVLLEGPRVYEAIFRRILSKVTTSSYSANSSAAATTASAPVGHVDDDEYDDDGGGLAALLGDDIEDDDDEAEFVPGHEESDPDIDPEDERE